VQWSTIKLRNEQDQEIQIFAHFGGGRNIKKGNGKELEILFIQLHLETSHQVILSIPILPFMHLQVQKTWNTQPLYHHANFCWKKWVCQDGHFAIYTFKM